MMARRPTSGLLSPTAPAWSIGSDAHVTLAFGRLLHTYSLRTSPPTRVATLVGHDTSITGVVSLPGLRVISGAADGTLREWDQLSGHCLRTRDLGRPVHAVAAIDAGVLVMLDNAVLLHPLGLPDSRMHKLLRGFSPSSNMHIASSRDGRVIACASDKLLFLIDANHETDVPGGWVLRRHIYFPAPITALAVDPSGSFLAVGDETGMIHLRTRPRDLFKVHNYSKRASGALTQDDFRPTVFHWHASAVRALGFSADCTALLSAGREAVLVSWSLSRARFGMRSFLPRLHAPVIGLAPASDGGRVALVHSDNAVRVIDSAAAEVVAELRGLAVKMPTPGDIVAPTLSVCPAGGPRLLVATDDPRVQVFDAIRGEHIANIPVIPRNVVYEQEGTQKIWSNAIRNDDKYEGPGHPCVTAVARSPDGRWLATVDEQIIETKATRNYCGEHRAIHLRFWRVLKDDKFELVTVIPNPHGVNMTVSDLEFHPTLPVLVSTSPSFSSGSFRLWRAVDSSAEKKHPIFRCEMELGHRGLPCRAARFADDGSLLAVACGNVLTLWHVEDLEHRAELPTGRDPCSLNVEFVQALVHPPAEEDIRAVDFLMHKVPIFVASTGQGIYLWNAITQSVWWSIRMRVNPSCLTVDCETGRIALAVQIPVTVGGMDNSADANEPDDKDTSDGNPVSQGDDNSAHDKLETKKGRRSRKQGMKRLNKPSNRLKGKDKDSKEDEEPVKEEHHVKNVHSRRKWSAFTDWAIAIFDASSPVPLQVTRLASAVTIRALAFVDAPSGSQRPGKRLICIDSNMEVSLVGAETDTDQISLVSAESALLGKDDEDPGGNIVELLGEDWKELSVTNYGPSKTDDVKIPTNLQKAFETHFDGPLHIQAPISTKSFDFMRSILNAVDDEENAAEDSGASGETAKVKGEVQDADEAKATSEKSEKSKSVSLEDEEISKFCRKVVQAAQSKSKKLAKKEMTQLAS